jgi:hypothetical protein
MKAHKHVELIKQWADGAKVQRYNMYGCNWADDPAPTWHPEFEYRIAEPAAKVMKMNIDWELFKKQKELLLTLADDYSFLPQDIEMIDGVINLLDAIQDEFEPEELK